MAIDYDVIDETNAPKRHRAIAKYLVEEDPDQLAALDESSKEYYDFFYGSDFDEENVPYITLTFISKDATSVTVGVTDYSGDVTSYDADHSDKVWDGVAPANPTPSTAFTVTAGEGTYTWGDTVPGHHKVLGVDATDPQGEGNPAFLEVIYAPASPTTIAAADGTEESVVTWDAMDGAASYTIWYIDDAVGTETAADIISGGESIPGTNPAGTTITGLTASTTCRVTVTATNPGGTSDGGTPDNATIS
jgi:hypothetical protein